MLPVLEAISFNKILTNGGRTKPWLIYVNVKGSRVPYVVKLFTPDQVDDNAVVHEVFGSVLAKEFDLCTPEPALINFSSDFMKLLPNDVRDLLLPKDQRIKFGCEYHSRTVLLDIEVIADHKDLMINKGTIFAFDNFINNTDRGQYKTNILLETNGDGYWLIDHEKAFQKIDDMYSDIQNNNFSNILTNHVLYSILSNSRMKKELFYEFNEYLRALNVDILDSYYDQLCKYDIVYTNYDKLISYIRDLKNKGTWFTNILTNSLQ